MEWINASRRLPTDFTWVLVSVRFLGDGRSWSNIAMIDNGEWRFINTMHGTEADFGNVSHWMPLPPPPTNKE